MTLSDVADEMPTWHQDRSRPKLRKAIGFSVFLHLGVLGFASQYSFRLDNSAEQPLRQPGIEVILTELRPPSIQAVPAEPAESLAPLEISGTETAIPQLDSIIQDEGPEIPVSGDTGRATPTTEATLNPETLISQEVAGQGTEPVGLAPQQLQEARAAFVREHQLASRRAWLQDCTAFRQSNIFEECPQGANFISSPVALHIRVIEVSAAETAGSNEGYSAGEDFRRMTQTDIFNPDMLGGVIPLFGTGGGVINAGIGFMAEMSGFHAASREVEFLLAPASDTEAGHRE